MTVNRLQQTTYCTKVGHTRSTRFFFHRLLKRCMKAQQLVQCMVPRALFGGVRNTSKSVYSSDSQLLLSRPSVSGAYLRSTQEKQLLGYQLNCFQYVAAVFFKYRHQLFYFQYVAADVFFFCFVTVVLFLICSRCCFFVLAIESFRTTEQKERIGGQILLNAKTIS